MDTKSGNEGVGWALGVVVLWLRHLTGRIQHLEKTQTEVRSKVAAIDRKVGSVAEEDPR